MPSTLYVCNAFVGSVKLVPSSWSITSRAVETQQWPESLKSFSPLQMNCASSQLTTELDGHNVVEFHLLMSADGSGIQTWSFHNKNVRIATRRLYGLTVDSVVFGYGFDLNSTAIRKNPMAAIEAFQRAFPLPNLPSSFGLSSQISPYSEKVSLMIKTFSPRRTSPEWDLLNARVSEDPRIILIARSLSRDDLLSLYGCCDVFLSLRSGLWTWILKLSVGPLLFNFGGTPTFVLVPWHIPSIGAGHLFLEELPYADGHYWAEPNVDHAAQLCQQLAAQLFERVEITSVGDRIVDSSEINQYRERFSFSVVGKRIRDRLDFLWSKRQSISPHLQWTDRSSPQRTTNSLWNRLLFAMHLYFNQSVCISMSSFFLSCFLLVM